MTIKAIIILVALANLLLGGLLFIRARKNRAAIAFSVFALSLGLWSLALYFYEHPIFFSHLIWIKIVYSLVLFPVIPSAFYFALNFLESHKKRVGLPITVYFPIATALFIVLWFSKLWVKGVVVRADGLQTLLGPAYIVFGIASGAFGLWLLVILIKKYLKFEGLLKMQLRYIFLGLFLYIGFTVLVDVVVPLVSGNSSYFWLSPIFSLFFIATTVYAITRYRLMDIRLVVGRSSIYIFSFLSVVGVGYLLFFLNNFWSRSVPFNIFFPAVLIISGLCFKWFFKLFERVAARYFYYTFYSYQKVLTELGERLTQILDLNKLSALIVETLQTTMKLDRTVVLLRERGGRYVILKNIGFKEENGISLVRDNFLTNFLQKTKKPVVFEELSLLKMDITNIEERENISRVQKNMERIEASVCLPLLRAEEIAGIVVLGRKISRDSYSKEDLELLSVLASQASIALENARLYDEVRDMSHHLQDKVDEQTKELTIAYKELKRTDLLKSEFLSMSSHQLRTPLTIIKGYLSMALEGDYGKVPPKLKSVLGNVFTASQRLVKIVGDLLDISRADLGKMKLEKSLVKIDCLIQSCCEEMRVRAEEKGLKLSCGKPKSSLPKLEIDESKIRQVILNLLDNAVRYTAKGRVVISTEKKNNHILIKVSDTGVGLTKGEQEDIFEGFTRGTAGINYFTEGAGLGLYVARKYLQLHKGKIWAESEGKGKGSRFFVELPVGKNI